MNCAFCDHDFTVGENASRIEITEIDYDREEDHKMFCSFYCLKRWYDL